MAGRWRAGVGLYLLVVAGVTAVFAARAIGGWHPWIAGEWLISYAGGFVRRGLAGSVVLGLARVGLPVPVALGVVVGLLYASWYWTVWRLTAGVRWSVGVLAMVVSPATMAFSVLDPPSSVRKEVVLFLLAGGLCLLLRARRWGWAGLVFAVGAPLVVLMHEGLAVFLPLPAAVLVGWMGWRRSWMWVLGGAVLAGGALGAAVRHPGGSAAETVCAAVVQRAPVTVQRQAEMPDGVCGGAIGYLRWSAAEARAQTVRSIAKYGYWTVYSWRAVLALLPAAWVLRGALREGGQRRAQARAVLVGAGVSGVLSVGLFVVARDWGRWLEIHATLLLLVLLLLEQRREGESAVRPGAGAAAWVGLALYATCWTMPAVGIYPGRWGYVDLVRYVRGYRTGAHMMRDVAGVATGRAEAASDQHRLHSSNAEPGEHAPRFRV